MKPVKINAIAFEDADGGWVAQCIEYDIAVRADTLLELSKVLEREVQANLHVNAKLGRPGLSGIPPAPQHFRLAFQAAKSKFFPESKSGKMSVKIDEVRVVEPLAA
jgi:hypothetical protein